MKNKQPIAPVAPDPTPWTETPFKRMTLIFGEVIAEGNVLFLLGSVLHVLYFGCTNLDTT